MKVDLSQVLSEGFQAGVSSWCDDYDSMHTYRNEIDHAALRHIIQSTSCKHPVKVTYALARAFTRKVRQEHQRLRARFNILSGCTRPLNSNQRVSKAYVALKKRTRLRPKGGVSTRKLRTGRSPALEFLNERTREHRAIHGSMSKDQFRTFRQQVLQEWHSLDASHQALFHERVRRAVINRHAAQRLSIGVADAANLNVAAPATANENLSLWNLGSADCPLRPDTVLLGQRGLQSYTAAAEAIEASKDIAGLGGIVIDGCKGHVNAKALAEYRVKSCTCHDLHPGLCRTVHASYLKQVLFTVQQINEVADGLDAKDTGQALMCFQGSRQALPLSVGSSSDRGPSCGMWLFVFLTVVSKSPKRQLFTCLSCGGRAPDTRGVHLRYPGDELEFPLCLELMANPGLVELTNFEVALILATQQLDECQLKRLVFEDINLKQLQALFHLLFTFPCRMFPATTTAGDAEQLLTSLRRPQPWRRNMA